MKRELTLPRGVSIRDLQSERRLQVAFSYRGFECRELLPPGPINQTTIELAAGLRAEIRRHIAQRTFVYTDYFPDSPRAAQFGRSSRHVKMSELLDQQEKAYRAMVTNKALSPSTCDGYIKAINSARMKFWRDKTLAEATPGMLREWIRSLDVTSKFARNLLTPLRSVFDDALNDELIRLC